MTNGRDTYYLIAINNKYEVYSNIKAEGEYKASIIQRNKARENSKVIDLKSKLKKFILLNTHNLVVCENHFYILDYKFDILSIYEPNFEIFAITRITDGYNIYDRNDNCFTVGFSDIDSQIEAVKSKICNDVTICQLSCDAYVLAKKKNEKQKNIIYMYSDFKIPESEFSYNKNKMLCNNDKEVQIIDIFEPFILERIIFESNVTESGFINNLTKFALCNDNKLYTFSKKYGNVNLTEKYNIKNNVKHVYPYKKRYLILVFDGYVDVIDLRNNKHIERVLKVDEVEAGIIEKERFFLIDKKTRLKIEVPIK